MYPDGLQRNRLNGSWADQDTAARSVGETKADLDGNKADGVIVLSGDGVCP